MNEADKGSYITWYKWMREDLQLKGVALFVYAAIYGFSHNGTNEYTSNNKWLAHMIGCSEKSVRIAQKYLISRGLIKKRERNKKTGQTNAYVAVPPPPVSTPKKGKGGVEVSTEGGWKSVPPPSEMSSTPRGSEFHPINNIISKDISSQKERDKEKVLQKQREQAEFFERFPNVEVDGCCGDMLDIDFPLLARRIDESDYLKQVTSFTWLARHWAKIKTGYYKTYRRQSEYPSEWEDIYKCKNDYSYLDELTTLPSLRKTKNEGDTKS